MYQCSKSKLPGSNYKEVIFHTREVFGTIEKRTKRQPYIRSAYFLKQKIFFNLFWKHLFDKSFPIRTKRLKYFEVGIELIQKSRNAPTSHDNPNNTEEILHRFSGITKEKEEFFVQIKETKRTGKKYLMSMFGSND